MAIELHPQDDDIERYCLGSLAGRDGEQFEEHLLICASCQDRVRQTEQYIQTFRKAAAEERNRGEQRARWAGWPAAAAGLAGLAALSLVWLIGPAVRGGNGAPFAVALQATRGGDALLRAHAPAGTPLLLHLDFAGVKSLPSYRVRVVDQGGRPIFEGSAAPNAGRLTVSTAARLRAGLYWVRLYDPSQTEQPLREFGLELDAKR